MNQATAKMDYLLKFIETVFFHYDCDLNGKIERAESLGVSETDFIASLRKIHPELSDDTIRLIFKKYTDEWCHCPEKGIQDKNVFYAFIYLTQETLVINDNNPHVKFEHLFRWKEVTELTGETLAVCTFLAYEAQYHAASVNPEFDWANILPTDNYRLYHIFREHGLSDLHQHLKASTSVFTISWVCLMNVIIHRNGQFERLLKDKRKAAELYIAVTLAACIRLYLYRLWFSGEDDEELRSYIEKNGIEQKRLNIQFEIDAERLACKSRQRCFIYDYATKRNFRPMAIFMGERRLLYETLKQIYAGDKRHITSIFFRYIHIKSRLRKELVQLNRNVGFSNFSEFEQKKEIFLDGKDKYASLLLTLPLYEAKHYYCQGYLETRIAPQRSYALLRKKYNRIVRLNAKQEDVPDYQLIYHFIKQKDDWAARKNGYRNYAVRQKTRKEANALEKLCRKKDVDKFIGIDAANSEFYCRPEVFAEAYEKLSLAGISHRTFHVGEDFYDITDGLRAIDEAITFLKLTRGDRLGHAIALGIDPQRYYAERNYHIAVPHQVLVDNMVWLRMKAAELNVAIPPNVKSQMLNVVNNNINFDWLDYYRAMKIRNESPETYDLDKNLDKDLNKSRRLSYFSYLFGENEANDKIDSFKICLEYVGLIEKMQDRMMDEIEKRQLVIECCPSSNYRIGRLRRFEDHPIIRFCNVRKEYGHHLPVTVNTDDLGIFYTSLPREFELLTLALLKKKDEHSNLMYNTQEVYDWIERIVKNAQIYRFKK